MNPLKKLKVREEQDSHPRSRCRRSSQADASPRADETLRETSPRLVAFFGSMYFAGLRPRRSSECTKWNLSLPPAEWDDEHERWSFPAGVDGGESFGSTELFLRSAGNGRTPDNGTRRAHSRGVERRTHGRAVLAGLTSRLWDHLHRFGTTPNGRLFWGRRSGGDCPALSTAGHGRTHERQRSPLGEASVRPPARLRVGLARCRCPSRPESLTGRGTASLY